jgi:glycosyltransferase involved in cell wall biosynthesis
MRILYIVQHFVGPTGVGSSRAFEATTRLAAAGHEVTLLCGTFEGLGAGDLPAARQRGVTVVCSPIAYEQRLSERHRMVRFVRFMLWALCRAVAARRPDVVFASSTPLTIGVVGALAGWWHRVPFVFEVRDLWPEIPIALGVPRNPWLIAAVEAITDRVYRAATQVIALSSGMAARIIERGVPEERVTVIPNCADVQTFGVRRSRRRLRRELGWTGRLICIHAGSMGRVNGLGALLDAAAVLDARGIEDVVIALVGDGAERAVLEARARAEGLRSVRFYHAFAREAMPDVLGAADVGLVTFRNVPWLHTNSANKFFDCLASRLPVVINYGGWQAQELAAADAGVSVAAGGPEAIADALVALRDDVEGRRRMAAHARQLAERKFARTLLVDLLVSVLAGAVDQTGSNGPRQSAEPASEAAA